MYKNIDKQAKLCLKDLVDYRDGQIVSRTLVQNNLVSMTLFSFDKGEEISTHAAGGDAMVTVLEGTGRFTVGGDVFIHEIPLAHQLHLGCVPTQRIQRFLRHAVQRLGMIVHQFDARVMKVEKRRIFPLFP